MKGGISADPGPIASSVFAIFTGGGSFAVRGRSAASSALALLFAGCTQARVLEQSGPSRRDITLLHVADLHSHLFSESSTLTERDAELGLGEAGQTVLVGGAARLASVLDEEKSGAATAFLFDAGDVFEGSPTFPLFGGEPELRVQSALGVDAQALGNHDLSLGAARLSALRARWAHFPLLAVNLAGPIDAGLVVPSLELTRDGVRVAVIGLGRLPDGAPDVEASARAAQQVIDDVRGRSDLVVLLSHLGSDLDRQLVPMTTGADVLLGGHTHDVLSPPASIRDCGASLALARHCRSRTVPVVHSGAFGRFVGVVHFVVSSDPLDVAQALDDRPSIVVDVKSSLIPVTGSVRERADVAALLMPYRERLDALGLSGAIAYAPVAVRRAAPHGGDSALGNFVTRALRAEIGADVAIVNTTGIRSDVATGTVTAAELYRVLPFEDAVDTCEMSGSALIEGLQVASRAACTDPGWDSPFQIDGATVSVSCSSGSKKPTVTAVVRGRSVGSTDTLRVAVTSFSTGPGGWFDSVSCAAPGETVRDTVTEYVGALPSCPGSAGSLPCLDGSAGAGVDGRIQKL